MNLIQNICQKNYWTNTYGLARSFLAISLLLTLTFNSKGVIIPTIEGVPVNVFIHGEGFNKFNFFILFGHEYYNLMRFLACIILSLCVIGYYPRYLGIIHWWIAYSFITVSSAVDGGDQIAANLTLMLIPITLLDSRSNHFSKLSSSPNDYHSIIAFVSYIIIRLQVAVIYLHAAVGKLNVEEWINGTAVYYWSHHTFFKYPDWIAMSLRPFMDSNLLIFTITWGVIIFEILLFSTIVMPNGKLKRRIGISAIYFHLAILVLHGLVSFFFSISAALILSHFSVNHSLNLKIKNIFNHEFQRL